MPIGGALQRDGTALQVATWIGIALLLAAVAACAVQGVWQGVAVTTGFAAASAWGLWVRRQLPGPFRLVLVAAGLVAGLGWSYGLFDRLACYDDLAHVVTAIAVTVSFSYVLYRPLRLHFVRRRLLLYPVSLFCFGLSLGVLWEVGEWLFMGSLGDTETDLLADLLGAAAGALLATYSPPTRGTAEGSWPLLGYRGWPGNARDGFGFRSAGAARPAGTAARPPAFSSSSGQETRHGRWEKRGRQQEEAARR